MNKKTRHVISFIGLSLSAALISAQGYRGGGRPDPSEYDIDFDSDSVLGIWFIVIVVFISYKIWSWTIRKKDEEFSDGCLPMAVIGLVIVAIYILIRFNTG